MTAAWPDDPREYLLAYLDAWNAGDAARVCDAYLVPSVIHSEGAVHANLDEASRRAWLGDYVESTRPELAAGTRWECPSLEVTPLGSDGCLVTARWVFRRTDGSAVEDYFDSYLLVRVDGRWVFLADVIHATDTSGG
jgi:hypothetical protein